jgi:hypothetical protein
MEIAAFVVSLIAVAASGASVWYTRRATNIAREQAAILARSDYLARRPVLETERGQANFGGDLHATFTIVNKGPQHLDNVTVYAGDDATAVAKVNTHDWTEAVDFGSLGIGESLEFQLAVEVAWPRSFEVPVTTRAGSDSWDQTLGMEEPHNARMF